MRCMRSPYCARATSGAIAPPSSVMNARSLMGAPQA